MLRPWEFLQQQAILGDVVRISFGSTPFYLVNSSILVHRIYTQDAHLYDKGLFFDRVQSVFGEILPATTGEGHRRRRRLLQPAFQHEILSAYAQVMGESAAARAAGLPAARSVRIDLVLQELALEIAVQTLVSGGAGREFAFRFRQAMPVLLRGLLLQTVVPAHLRHVPFLGYRRYQQAAGELRRLFDTVVAERRAQRSAHADVLSTLLASNGDDLASISDDDVWNEALTLVMAAYVTIAHTTAWALHELASHPTIQRMAEDEARAVLADNPAWWEALPALEYTRRVVKEALRLYSVLLLTRRTVAKVRLGQAELPAGTNVAFSLFAIHRGALLYPEPLRFDPDRWLTQHTGQMPRHAFLPFGAGAYQCIGNEYAMMAMTIIISAALARWHLQPYPKHRVRMAASGPAVRPDQLPMLLTPHTAHYSVRNRPQ
jgi:cytochrome P450